MSDYALRAAAQRVLDVWEWDRPEDAPYLPDALDQLRAALASTPEQAEPMVPKRSLDLAIQRVDKANTYAMELQARLLKYEPGSPMVLNTAQAEQVANGALRVLEEHESTHDQARSIIRRAHAALTPATPAPQPNFNHAQGGQHGESAPQDQRVSRTVTAGNRRDEQDQGTRSDDSGTDGRAAREFDAGSALDQHRGNALAAGADGPDAGRGATDVLLTPDEIKALWCGCRSIANHEFAIEYTRAVESALRRKTPQPAESAETKPVAWMSEVQCIGSMYGKRYFDAVPIQSLQHGYYKHTPLYSHPPRRARMLTDEEINAAWAAAPGDVPFHVIAIREFCRVNGITLDE